MRIRGGLRWSLVCTLIAACGDDPFEGTSDPMNNSTSTSTTGPGETTDPTTLPDTLGTTSSSTTDPDPTDPTSSSPTDPGTTDTSSSTSDASTTFDTSTGVAQVCTPDEVEPCYDGPPGTEGIGACQPGTRTCLPDGTAYGPCAGQVLPAGEQCDNAVDDDCDAVVNQPEAGCVCPPGAIEPCYDGPDGTLGEGVCIGGNSTCAGDGLGFGACEGQVLPVVETCDTPVDDDCDGQVNEDGPGCACVPNTQGPCYSGPPGTDGVGSCKAGTQTCNAQGSGFDACTGEVLPTSETCNTPIDDDCDGQVNEDGPGCVCSPNSVAACYTGPNGTQGVGVCQVGTQTCNAQGTGIGACIGEVLPTSETCNTPIDDDCDGQVNEDGPGCACLPNSVAACYTGPNGTQGVGACQAGTQTCNAQGTGFGACTGEVVPVNEACNTPGDDNCDGQTNEGCPVVTYAADVEPILEAKCEPCHTGGSSGGLNVLMYASTQMLAGVCPGKTKGACTIVRIQNGSMPQNKGCTGNPTLDVGKPECLTAGEQMTLQAWINGGQPP